MVPVRSASSHAPYRPAWRLRVGPPRGWCLEPAARGSPMDSDPRICPLREHRVTVPGDRMDDSTTLVSVARAPWVSPVRPSFRGRSIRRWSSFSWVCSAWASASLGSRAGPPDHDLPDPGPYLFTPKLSLAGRTTLPGGPSSGPTSSTWTVSERCRSGPDWRRSPRSGQPGVELPPTGAERGLSDGWWRWLVERR